MTFLKSITTQQFLRFGTLGSAGVIILLTLFTKIGLTEFVRDAFILDFHYRVEFSIFLNGILSFFVFGAIGTGWMLAHKAGSSHKELKGTFTGGASVSSVFMLWRVMLDAFFSFSGLESLFFTTAILILGFCVIAYAAKIIENTFPCLKSKQSSAEETDPSESEERSDDGRSVYFFGIGGLLPYWILSGDPLVGIQGLVVIVLIFVALTGAVYSKEILKWATTEKSWEI